MKLFGQRDELFEIMAQAAARQRGAGGPTPKEPPVAPVPSGSTTRPSATTSTALARAGLTAPQVVRGPLGQGELVEIEGDALVVIDDEAEVAPPPSPTASDGMRLFALRLDTAAVGGVLVAGLLFGSFLLGRTTGGGGEKSIEVEVAATPPDVEATPEKAPAATQGGTGSVPASVPREAGHAAAQEQAPPAPPAREAARGTQMIQVCHTTPEKAVSLAKWLNEDPRSPIFGRGDLEASAKGGSVRISGFATREAEVLARVQATSDPTGGSGAFRDAYYQAVR